MNGSHASPPNQRPAPDGLLGEVLDLEHLSRQTLNDPDLEREVVGMFFEQSAEVLRQIRDAGEHRKRSEAAHRLKGSARAVGAWGVAEARAVIAGLLDRGAGGL
jgi:hypothetical protein